MYLLYFSQAVFCLAIINGTTNASGIATASTSGTDGRLMLVIQLAVEIITHSK